MVVTIKYVNDNSHSSEGERPHWNGSLEQAFSEIEEGQIFVEDINTSRYEKSVKEKLYNKAISGEVQIEGDRIMDGDNYLEFGGSSIKELIETAIEYSDNIERIDTGPVYDPELIEQGRRAFEEAEAMGDIGVEDMDLYEDVLERLAEHIEKRDEKYESYIEEMVEDPDNTVITMGAAHPLVERLKSKFDVEEMNEANLSEFNRKARQMVAP